MPHSGNFVDERVVVHFMKTFQLLHVHSGDLLFSLLAAVNHRACVLHRHQQSISTQQSKTDTNQNNSLVNVSSPGQPWTPISSEQLKHKLDALATNGRSLLYAIQIPQLCSIVWHKLPHKGTVCTNTFGTVSTVRRYSAACLSAHGRLSFGMVQYNALTDPISFSELAVSVCEDWSLGAESVPNQLPLLDWHINLASSRTLSSAVRLLMRESLTLCDTKHMKAAIQQMLKGCSIRFSQNAREPFADP